MSAKAKKPAAIIWAPAAPCARCSCVVFSGVADDGTRVEHTDVKGQPILCLPRAKR